MLSYAQTRWPSGCRPQHHPYPRSDMSFSSSFAVRTRSYAPIAAVALVAATAACGSDSTAPSGPVAVVQFVNAAPRYPNAKVIVDSTVAVSSIGYGTGAVAFSVRILSTPRIFSAITTMDTTTLASIAPTLVENTLYRIVFTQETVKGSFILLPDTVSAPASGKAAVQVVNAAPAAGNVDIYLTTTTAAITDESVHPTVANVGYKGTSQYIPFTAGAMRVRVTTAGTKKRDPGRQPLYTHRRYGADDPAHRREWRWSPDPACVDHGSVVIGSHGCETRRTGARTSTPRFVSSPMWLICKSAIAGRRRPDR